MLESISGQLKKLKSARTADYVRSERLYNNGNCQILTNSKNAWDVLISDEEEDIEWKIKTDGNDWYYFIKGKPAG